MDLTRREKATARLAYYRGRAYRLWRLAQDGLPEATVKMPAWFWGWKETLRIMIFHRDLYHHLKQPMNPDDFGEVSRPQ